MIGSNLHPVDAQHTVARLRSADNAAMVDKKPLVCFLNMQIAVMSRPFCNNAVALYNGKGLREGPLRRFACSSLYALAVVAPVAH